MPKSLNLALLADRLAHAVAEALEAESPNGLVLGEDEREVIYRAIAEALAA